MPKKLITFFILLIVFTGAIYKLQQQSYPDLPENLLFQRIDGTNQTLAEFSGRPLLVTFWSPNCVICLQEVDQLNAFYKTYRGGKQFELLAISMYYDRPDQVIQISQQTNMQFPVYFDLLKEVSRAFGHIVATPTSFLIDTSGQIIYHQTGPINFSLVGQKLKQLTG